MDTFNNKISIKKLLDDLKSHSGIEEYFRDDSYSYSRIKNCYTDPKSLFKEDKISSIFMDIGSAVDIMLTSPLESDRIKQLRKIPSETNIQISHYLLFNYPKIKTIEEVTDKMIKDAYGFISPKNRWTPEVQRTKFFEDASEYYKLKMENYNAILLTPDIYNNTLKIVETLRTHHATRHLFNNTYQSPDTIIYYQYSYKEDNYNEIPIKILIDIMEVNVKTNTIQQYDLKIGDNGFFKSYWKFKWYYQAALYRDVGEVLANTISDILGVSDDYSNMFEVLPFKFIHVQPSKPTIPVIYKITEGTHNELIYSGYKDRTYLIPSLHSVLNAAKYYKTHIERLQSKGQEINPNNITPYYLVATDHTIEI